MTCLTSTTDEEFAFLLLVFYFFFLSTMSLLTSEERIERLERILLSEIDEDATSVDVVNRAQALAQRVTAIEQELPANTLKKCSVFPPLFASSGSLVSNVTTLV
jgi:hypothetical protein